MNLVHIYNIMGGFLGLREQSVTEWKLRHAKNAIVQKKNL